MIGSPPSLVGFDQVIRTSPLACGLSTSEFGRPGTPVGKVIAVLVFEDAAVAEVLVTVTILTL
jgi:hypothetical protein